MKKITYPWKISTYAVLTISAILLAGCTTEHFYDTPVTNTANASPSQTADAQTALESLNDAQTGSDPSQPQATILRQGDIVKISFPGSPNLDQTEQIRLDGKISMPLVGDVQAAGMRPEELQQNLIKLYAPQISSSDVNVAIESSSFPIFVTGCVLSPGKVSSNEPITALEAIMEAGGFDYARANLRRIHVIRRGGGTSQSYVLNLRSVLNGEDQNNFFLQPNDIIYVPEKFSWF
jgi:polysaccharide export outer membrane protein